MWTRIEAFFSRKFIIALAGILLVTFKLDTNADVTAAVDGAIAAVFVLAQALQNTYIKKD
jgi:uncharacterized membrane protein